MDPRGTVLLADDEPIVLRTTCEFLRRHRYECHTAENAEQALRILEGHCPDLIVAEIGMPGNRRLQLVEEAGSRAPGIPVILTTDRPSLESAISSLRLPVVSYLLKPLNFDEFKEQVGVWTRYSRLYKSVQLMCERARAWTTELEEVEEFLREDRAQASRLPPETYLALALKNAVDAALDLKHLTEAQLDAGDGSRTIPRPGLVTETLEETVEILQRTKRAFKSNELGLLRQKLEGVLKDLRGSGNNP